MENIFSPVGSPVRADRPPSSLGQEAIEAPVEPQFLQNWGVAEFTMKRKQSWNFHHGVCTCAFRAEVSIDWFDRLSMVNRYFAV